VRAEPKMRAPGDDAIMSFRLGKQPPLGYSVVGAPRLCLSNPESTRARLVYHHPNV
jgi:hypothetical protein